jgi:nucleotide-binding universal stress UspA family protein
MFERVLAPLDGSALAASILPHLARIAPAGAQTLLLRVLEQNVEATLNDPLEWRMRRDVAEVYLEDVAQRIGQETGLQPVSRVEEGSAADRILAVAREWDAQLIALCSHGAGGLNAWNLNSVAFKVAQRTGTSLLLVRGYRFSSESPDETLASESYRRILVPMDGSLRAEHVLGAADAIASGMGATIVLAHVVQPPRYLHRRSGSEIESIVDGAIDQFVAEAQSYLDEVAAGLQSATEVRVLRDRDPAAALHALAADEGVDLVLVSAHGQSGQRYWPQGGLATSFILHGTTTLLVLQDVPWDDLLPSQAEMSASRPPAPGQRATGTLPGETGPIPVA